MPVSAGGGGGGGGVFGKGQDWKNTSLLAQPSSEPQKGLSGL